MISSMRTDIDGICTLGPWILSHILIIEYFNCVVSIWFLHYAISVDGIFEFDKI